MQNLCKFLIFFICVVTLRQTAMSILSDFSQRQIKDDPEREKVHTAAKLIKNDIRSIAQSLDTYPSYQELAPLEEFLNFVPASLKLLLHKLFVGKEFDFKVASIGQAIIQASRPRVLICPLQIGLEIQMPHQFASRSLIDSLHKHGFASSYTEVKKFEGNAATNQGTELPEHISGQFVQFVADNVDHDLQTIDRLHTFHGMGIIGTVTPGTKLVNYIPRKSVSAEQIRAVA